MNYKNEILVLDVLSFWDWFVFFLILLITFVAVIYGQHLKKNLHLKTEEESFLDLLIMGRKLTLPLFVATLVSSWYGGIFGVTQISFEKGIFNFITQGFFWYLTYIFLAFFIVKKIRNYRAITFPELVGEMYGPKSAKISAIFNFFNILPIAYTISVGLFLQLIFGGSLLTMMGIGTFIVVLYSYSGGFRADVFSDLVQFYVMCLSVVIVVFFSYYQWGGYTFLTNNLPASHFSLTGGGTLAQTLIWGFISLGTLVDPSFYQRIVAADSIKTAQRGIYISTLIWFIFDICTTLGGMYAKAVIPHANSQNAYLIYALQLLPSGVRGFFLAGILATILSTMDTFLLIGSTTISYDLISKKHNIKMNHIILIFVGILCVVMGHYFNGNIKLVWKTLGSYWSACLLLPILYGYYFPKKVHDGQFVFATLLGVIGTTYWRNSAHDGFWKNFDELYAGMFTTGIGLMAYAFYKQTTAKHKKKH